ncbi:MAG TPA: hypothetical protein ENJ45_06220 [Phaeodactylibacter sp.]|nr:hypothetical protein [Phaeodactylibacter sp.]
MTHQLNIKAPFSFAERQIAIWNHKLLSPYDLYWVPDVEEAPGIAGDLSHPSPLEPVRYVGILSAVQKKTERKSYHVIAVLSGPEPQRSRLEKMILHQADKLSYSFLVVRGKMEDKRPLYTKGNISIVGHLLGNDLSEAMSSAEVVIARSGYSTIMDLLMMEKKAILIPTPGQTEQEYLATLYKQEKIFFVQSQKDFDLRQAMEELAHYDVPDKKYQSKSLGCFVEEWMALWKKKGEML